MLITDDDTANLPSYLVKLNNIATHLLNTSIEEKRQELLLEYDERYTNVFVEMFANIQSIVTRYIYMIIATTNEPLEMKRIAADLQDKITIIEKAHNKLVEYNKEMK